MTSMEHWYGLSEAMLENGTLQNYPADFTLDPNMNIYEANRDLMRARRAEWHEDYTLPSLWTFYEPSSISHGYY
jgi:hypothetical protein